jgi:hypothetical protein
MRSPPNYGTMETTLLVFIIIVLLLSDICQTKIVILAGSLESNMKYEKIVVPTTLI